MSIVIYAFVVTQVAQLNLVESLAELMFAKTWRSILTLIVYVAICFFALTIAISDSINDIGRYLALGVFIVVKALFIAPLLVAVATYASDILEKSLQMLLSLGGGLFSSVIFSRKDFKFLERASMFGIWTLAIIALGSIITGFTLGTFYSFLMVLVYGMSILWILSLIMDAEDDGACTKEQPIEAAMMLFICVEGLFIGLLTLLLSLSE